MVRTKREAIDRRRQDPRLTAGRSDATTPTTIVIGLADVLVCYLPPHGLVKNTHPEAAVVVTPRSVGRRSASSDGGRSPRCYCVQGVYRQLNMYMDYYSIKFMSLRCYNIGYDRGDDNMGSARNPSN